MKQQLSSALTAHFVGFLLSLLVLAQILVLGVGVLATILYWGNFEGMRENVSLSEIWAQVVSPKTGLAFVGKAYPWGLLIWLAGGLLVGGLCAVIPSEKTQRRVRFAVSVFTGFGVSLAMNGMSSNNPGVLVANLLVTALTVPAFYLAVALSRWLPKFYEWLRDTEVNALFRR